MSLQYGDLYFVRLTKLRPIVVDVAKNKWPGVPLQVKVLETSPGEKTVVVGTLFKQMKLKPCILDEYTKQSGVAPQQLARFVSDDDSLVLEDESGRIQLKGEALDVQGLSTGLVVAMIGVEDDTGIFVVEDICFPGLPPQPMREPKDSEDNFLVLVSGLQLGSPSCNPATVQMFADFVTGHLGGTEDQELAAKVVAVVVAGNSISAEDDVSRKFDTKAPVMSATQQAAFTAPLKELDTILTQLASSVTTVLMPGESDPAAHFLPQQPLHRCLLPSAHGFETFMGVTNPCEIVVGSDCRIMGTAGQNIDDLDKYCKLTSRHHPAAGGHLLVCAMFEQRVDALENTLNWRVLAPTAPDTLGCYPFLAEDPFLATQCPHVYFAGNQPEFATKELNGPDGQRVRVVCVPSFQATGTAVLVNTKTLDCTTLEFGANFPKD